MKNYTKQINKVIDFVISHLDRSMTVEELAEVAGMSAFHFHRVFSEETGETIARFITRRRMEKAGRELSRNYDIPIAEVAFSVGYSSAALFCRNFKTHYGVTATEYRSKKQEENSKNRQSQSNKKEEISLLTRYLCERKTIRKGDKIMNCSFEIKNLDPKSVIYYRHQGEYDKMGPSINKLMQWAYPRGLVNNLPRLGAVYLDDPQITPTDKLQSDIFLVVEGDVKVDGEIGKYTIDGGLYAVGRFEIAMSEFSDAWQSMCGLITEHGCQSVDGYHHDLYLNNADEHPEKKFIVDICTPVKAL